MIVVIAFVKKAIWWSLEEEEQNDPHLVQQLSINMCHELRIFFGRLFFSSRLVRFKHPWLFIILFIITI